MGQKGEKTLPTWLAVKPAQEKGPQCNNHVDLSLRKEHVTQLLLPVKLWAKNQAATRCLGFRHAGAVGQEMGTSSQAQWCTSVISATPRRLKQED